MSIEGQSVASTRDRNYVHDELDDDESSSVEPTSSEADDSSENDDDEEEAPISNEDAAAQIAIENDFDRLVQNVRSNERSQSLGLSKEWDFAIEDQDAEFKDDLRAASGIGRPRRKKGRHEGPALSPEVRALIGEGNQAYVDCNTSEAIKRMQEVIRIEPRAHSAWTVLAQCYEDLKENQKALQLRIMAAHLRHDADEWDRLAKQSRDLGYHQQALYCYRKVNKLDPSNIHAFWDLATLSKELGDFKLSRNAFLAILKRFPHDLNVLNELRTILIELSEFTLCASLFQHAFDHFAALHPSGRGSDPLTGGDVAGGGFGLMEILVLADLYNTLEEYERAVNVIRRGCRWLQGRSEQKYWDICTDDREYDIPDEDGRSSTQRRNGEPRPGCYPLDVNARHRLAVSRLKMGDTDEGKSHANIVLAEDVLDYAPLFSEIADVYFEREMYADAKPIYELLGSGAATSSLYILLQTAACLRMSGELQDAAEVYEHIRETDPSNNDVKMKLASLYELLDEPRKALALVYEVIDARKRRRAEGQSTDGNEHSSSTPTAQGGASLFEEKKKATKSVQQRKLTLAQLKELEAKKEAQVVSGYRRLTELWPAMVEDAGDAEKAWMEEAEKLVETYRETRNLFAASRQWRGMFPRARAGSTTEADEDSMASRLHLDLERDSMMKKLGKSSEAKGDLRMFRGVSFDDWMNVFMQYAFLLTKRGQHDIADEVLRHILLSSPYQDRSSQNTIRLSLITCAIVNRRYDIVVEQCRKLITVYQFNNEPFRLLLASLASGLRPTDAFITSTLQKAMLREVKLWDSATTHPETMKFVASSKRWVSTSLGKSGDDAGADEEDDAGDMAQSNPAESASASSSAPKLPTTHNPLLPTIYGQLCICAKSYQSAIFYLLLAYDHFPNDPVICLCLAIASFGRAMQRQADNRHHLIAQGMAFLTRYRKLRSTSAASVEELEEVEFNFGRAFHQLGLYSFAVKHYDNVLKMARQHPPNDLGVSKEAAYNLAMIYVLTGATPLAEALYRNWLSI
ncbi:transcription factor TFIIIC subunit tfc4 [Pleurotus pulmonarius]|nr:transcription factor TFIIIC subunit tfc4 [Pleurotus pulmonarius]KAF4600159.1 transcription factor TFIIIC subunit tfc4 [Pleurotus pulmonarius]